MFKVWKRQSDLKEVFIIQCLITLFYLSLVYGTGIGVAGILMAEVGVYKATLFWILAGVIPAASVWLYFAKDEYTIILPSEMMVCWTVGLVLGIVTHYIPFVYYSLFAA